MAKSTVSLALRGSDRVKPETARRVREVAERLHYRPDPLMSAFSSRRQELRHPQERATVGVLWPARKKGNLDGHAQTTLVSLGFRMDHFHLSEYRSPAHLASVLKARGIPALLVPEQSTPFELPGFPWEEFVAIQIGVGVTELPIDQVRYNAFDAVRQCWTQVRARGCRRIGGVFFHHGEDLSSIDEKLLAAFRLFQERSDLTARERIPPMVSHVQPGIECFPEWFRKHRPEVVIGPWPGLYQRHRKLLSQSQKFAGYAAVRTSDSCNGVAGCLVHARYLQLAAIHHLNHRLRETPLESGESPRCSIVVEPSWKEGHSLPPKGS